jgi:hypothetical protein
MSASARAYHSGLSQTFTNPGPAASARSTVSIPDAASAIAAATSRGGRLRSGATRSATLVA